MIKVYNIRETDINTKVGKYFKLSEFQSSDGYPIVIINTKLIDIADFIREFLGISVYINSGNRSVKLNDSLKNSSKTSKHMTGEAMDITFATITDKSIRDQVVRLAEMLGATGIGIDETYIHIDVGDREQLTKWTY